jgi:outer membrane protein
MKRFLGIGVLAAIGLSLSMVGDAAAQAQKLGFVNTNQIVAEAPGAAEARQSLEAEMQGYRTELDRLETELDSLQTAWERQQSTLSATARQQRQTELQQKFTGYQQRAAELQQTAQRREQELIAPLMQRIAGMIEEVRVEGGYSMIFDAAAGSIIVAADPALDVTQQVLAKLRAAPASN